MHVHLTEKPSCMTIMAIMNEPCSASMFALMMGIMNQPTTMMTKHAYHTCCGRRRGGWRKWGLVCRHG